jgi:hypothetical protein
MKVRVNLCVHEATDVRYVRMCTVYSGEKNMLITIKLLLSAAICGRLSTL